MAKTRLAKVVLTIRGTWSPTVEYEKLDLVNHLGSSYIAKRDNIGVTPVEGDDWSLSAEKGGRGDQGDKIYLHIAYANSEDGETDFTTSPVVDKVYTYLGQYSDYTAEDSTTPSEYRWFKLSEEAERAAAELLRVAAEEERVAAETAREHAESLRGSAESTRETAEETRVSNEQSRVSAEINRVSEESARQSAETVRVSSETDRQKAEVSRVDGEKKRVSAETDRADAETERIEGEQHRVSAEQSRSDAETVRVNNESARNTAEETRVSDESARKTAETSRVSAENKRDTSETERVNAETSRVNAETVRVNAEDARVLAEQERATAESARAAAENARVAGEAARESAETARASAESARAQAEDGRRSAEAARVAAEHSRASAESARAAAENARVEAETARANAENGRAGAETLRAAAEAERANAESGRVSAEQGRVSAESDRVAAEEARATEFAGYEARIDAVTPDDEAVDGKPWTSKHIVDMLCPPLEETGNPVQCYPVAGYPLGVKASWEPRQEGEGDPSPDNVRQITGLDGVTVTLSDGIGTGTTATLSLPSTVYGGEVDAVTGEGAKTIHRAVLDSTETWVLNSQMGDSGINGYQTVLEFPADDSYVCICSHFGGMMWDGILKEDSVATTSHIMVVRTNGSETLEDWKSFLAAQYAAGTPVAVAYKLATPTTFQATGGQAIPALPGTNTIYTDADSLTVTGRADPTHTIQTLSDRIAALESETIEGGTNA